MGSSDETSNTALVVKGVAFMIFLILIMIFTFVVRAKYPPKESFTNAERSDFFDELLNSNAQTQEIMKKTFPLVTNQAISTTKTIKCPSISTAEIKLGNEIINNAWIKRVNKK